MGREAPRRGGTAVAQQGAAPPDAAPPGCASLSPFLRFDWRAGVHRVLAGGYGPWFRGERDPRQALGFLEERLRAAVPGYGLRVETSDRRIARAVERELGLEVVDSMLPPGHLAALLRTPQAGRPPLILLGPGLDVPLARGLAIVHEAARWLLEQDAGQRRGKRHPLAEDMAVALWILPAGACRHLPSAAGSPPPGPLAVRLGHVGSLGGSLRFVGREVLGGDPALFRRFLDDVSPLYFYYLHRLRWLLRRFTGR